MGLVHNSMSPAHDPETPTPPAPVHEQPATGRASGAVADLDADFTRGETAMLLAFIFLMAALVSVCGWLVIELFGRQVGG